MKNTAKLGSIIPPCPKPCAVKNYCLSLSAHISIVHPDDGNILGKSVGETSIFCLFLLNEHHKNFSHLVEHSF